MKQKQIEKIVLKDYGILNPVFIAEKINEIIDFIQPRKEEKGFTYNEKGVDIEIVPSGRIDYCCECKKDHGYDCPLDLSKENRTVDNEWEAELKIKVPQWLNVHETTSTRMAGGIVDYEVKVTKKALEDWVIPEFIAFCFKTREAVKKETLDNLAIGSPEWEEVKESIREEERERVRGIVDQQIKIIIKNKENLSPDESERDYDVQISTLSDLLANLEK